MCKLKVVLSFCAVCRCLLGDPVVADLIPEINARAVVYGGSERQSRSDGEVLPLSDVGELLEGFEAGMRE